MSINKILILANSDIGLYRFRKEVIGELLKKNSVIIALPHGEYTEALIAMGCKYKKIKIDRHGINPLNDIILFCKYLFALLREKPDIVLTYTIKPNIYGGIACRLIQVPYLVNITGLGTAIENQSFLRRIVLFMYKHAIIGSQCIFFQNETNLNFALSHKMVKKKYRLLPGSGVNLCDYSTLPYPPDGEIKFLFIGRIMKSKGINELLSAVKLLKKTHPNIQLDIVGSMEEDFSDEFATASRQGLLVYYGEQKNVIQFIKTAHCIVLPSYHEGMANVLLEAAACARPVIASQIAGCQEAFEEGISGLGCLVGDVLSLKEAMETFLHLDYREKIEMGLAGRKRMEDHFDRRQVIKEYLNEINS